MLHTSPVGAPLVARMLITDQQNRILIVHTTGRNPRWGLPGGLAERCEPPRVTAQREVREETGLDAEAGALLALEWTPARTPGRRDRMTFYFTGPQLDQADIARIALQPGEVDDFRWADHDRARELLPKMVAQHIGYPLHNYRGFTYYIENPVPEGP